MWRRYARTRREGQHAAAARTRASCLRGPLVVCIRERQGPGRPVPECVLVGPVVYGALYVPDLRRDQGYTFIQLQPKRKSRLTATVEPGLDRLKV